MKIKKVKIVLDRSYYELDKEFPRTLEGAQAMAMYIFNKLFLGNQRTKIQAERMLQTLVKGVEEMGWKVSSASWSEIELNYWRFSVWANYNNDGRTHNPLEVYVNS